MKSKYIILSLIAITFMGFWMIGGALLNSGLSPLGLIGIPVFIAQSFQDQNVNRLCLEYCNPCWDLGPDHIVVDRECKIPESIDDCKAFYGDKKLEIKFIDNKCVF